MFFWAVLLQFGYLAHTNAKTENWKKISN